MFQEGDETERVVNIIKRTQSEDGYKLSIDLPLLQSILANPDVADLPVAIYCISGPFRTGKSFLCNLLLQHSNADILNLDFSLDIYSQIELENVFPFCGGVDRETEGVYILKKPVYVITETAKCVAIFLMDTQGLQDHKAATEECDIIGAVSFLMSSCLIYNVQSRVMGNDLEYIYRFAKFAKRVKEENYSHFSPFQSLTFLIRDWKTRDLVHGFEGGDQYINWLLDVTEEQADQHKFVRKELYDSFDVMNCFLAPPPGNIVEGLGKKECPLELKHIEGSFLNIFKIFFDRLFSGENIITKQIDGLEVTGRVLYTYMVEYAGVIDAGLEGNVKNFIQAEHQAEMQVLVDRYFRMYKDAMQKAFVPPFDWEKLAVEQKGFRENIIQKFDEEEHSVLPAVANEARNKLLSMIDLKFDKHKNKVDNEEILRNALMEYKQSLRSILPLQTDKQISKKHEKARENLLAELNKQIPDDRIVEYSQKFVENVQTIFVEMKEENDKNWKEAPSKVLKIAKDAVVPLITTILTVVLRR